MQKSSKTVALHLFDFRIFFIDQNHLGSRNGAQRRSNMVQNGRCFNWKSKKSHDTAFLKVESYILATKDNKSGPSGPGGAFQAYLSKTGPLSLQLIMNYKRPKIYRNGSFLVAKYSAGPAQPENIGPANTHTNPHNSSSQQTHKNKVNRHPPPNSIEVYSKSANLLFYDSTNNSKNILQAFIRLK